MEFNITNTAVYGIERSIVCSGNSYRTELRTEGDLNDKDNLRADRLGAVPVGSGHDSFLNGIVVTMDVTAPLYWWKQAQRYHWLEFISSQSTMHCVTKFNIADRCVNAVEPAIINIVQKMVDQFNDQTQYIKDNPELVTDEYKQHHNELWQKIIASLPCGFCLSATMTTNYRQIKTMCLQRKGHKLGEWAKFIDWAVNELPRFSELTGINNL